LARSSDVAAAFAARAARGICGRRGMYRLVHSVLDLVLSYFAVIFVILFAYPVLNQWLLEV